MIRFGLCCIFRKAPIKFRRTTAKYLSQFLRKKQLELLSDICLHNATSLMKALEYCKKNQILDFRINSQILPLKTHHEVGYEIESLPKYEQIIKKFQSCGNFCRANNIRTTFHPDQFILISSPNKSVVKSSVEELLYQAQVAQWVNGDVINLHGGGAYNDKTKSLARLTKQIEKLPENIRSRLTLENDDRVYTPKDLLPVCETTGVPFVYDVHHHRCLDDGISVEKTTEQALATWDREPLFHLSSPRDGWQSTDLRPHHDFIDPADFPACWHNLDITIEIEAKAKELAVLKIKHALKKI